MAPTRYGITRTVTGHSETGSHLSDSTLRLNSLRKIAALVSRGGAILDVGMSAHRMCRASVVLALVPRCARGQAGRGISDARVGREVQPGVSNLSAIPTLPGPRPPSSAKWRISAV